MLSPSPTLSGQGINSLPVPQVPCDVMTQLKCDDTVKKLSPGCGT